MKWSTFQHKTTAMLYRHCPPKRTRKSNWSVNSVGKQETLSNANSAIRVYFVLLVMTCTTGIRNDKPTWGRWVDRLLSAASRKFKRNFLTFSVWIVSKILGHHCHQKAKHQSVRPSLRPEKLKRVSSFQVHCPDARNRYEIALFHKYEKNQ